VGELPLEHVELQLIRGRPVILPGNEPNRASREMKRLTSQALAIRSTKTSARVTQVVRTGSRPGAAAQRRGVDLRPG
jgi:hypothetical protein